MVDEGVEKSNLGDGLSSKMETEKVEGRGRRQWFGLTNTHSLQYFNLFV